MPQMPQEADHPHILDDVILARMEAEREDFDPKRIISDLLGDLPKRAKNIVTERFGLNGTPKKTLEELGLMYHITRERVRQIETHSVATFTELKKRHILEPVSRFIRSVLYENGEAMEEEALLAALLEEDKKNLSNRNILHFLLSHMDEFYVLPESKQYKQGWAIVGMQAGRIQEVCEQMKTIFAKGSSTLSEDQVAELLKSDEALGRLVPNRSEKALFSYLGLSKEIARNPFGRWGLTTSDEIMPKGVRDKAYLVMLEHKKPLHFTKITEVINRTGFDRRVAHPQTVHNELIKDNRFVLVGRGMYALKEWGYEEGTVADILKEILSESPKPLNREELIQRVMKQRIVKRNTIIIGLQDKNMFKKLPGGMYTLQEQNR